MEPSGQTITNIQKASSSSDLQEEAESREHKRPAHRRTHSAPYVPQEVAHSMQAETTTVSAFRKSPLQDIPETRQQVVPVEYQGKAEIGPSVVSHMLKQLYVDDSPKPSNIMEYVRRRDGLESQRNPRHRRTFSAPIHQIYPLGFDQSSMFEH